MVLSLLKRPLVLLLVACGPLATFAACSTSNGDLIPEPSFDASPLDVPETPLPDGGPKPLDGAADAPRDGDAKIDAAPDPTNVRLSEVYVDNNFDGISANYVELRGLPGTPLGDLKLRVIDEVGTVVGEVDVTENAADVMPASGFWVVGGGKTYTVDSSASARVDRLLIASDLNLWGFDTSRGAVQLAKGTTLLDVLGYADVADAGAPPPPASDPKATVEGSIATIPAQARKSLSRKGADTNDNRADFCATNPTAGRTNAACL